MLYRYNVLKMVLLSPFEWSRPDESMINVFWIRSDVRYNHANIQQQNHNKNKPPHPLNFFFFFKCEHPVK